MQGNGRRSGSAGANLSSGRRTLRLPAEYYQQFDADYSLDVPAEVYGGWQRGEGEISWDHTALVVMGAWDPHTRDE